jgi:hypothetical protein
VTTESEFRGVSGSLWWMLLNPPDGKEQIHTGFQGCHLEGFLGEVSTMLEEQWSCIKLTCFGNDFSGEVSEWDFLLMWYKCDPCLTAKFLIDEGNRTSCI